MLTVAPDQPPEPGSEELSRTVISGLCMLLQLGDVPLPRHTCPLGDVEIREVEPATSLLHRRLRMALDPDRRADPECGRVPVGARQQDGIGRKTERVLVCQECPLP